ncbi:hypothetical protein ACFO1B_17320 [Dactylosporangium siamense]|uniref:Uncharacterized protein n=1 Tax=Dactylosporangium siamense TaxID=685454 RepID=A0A919PL74_9ACTN|nr:hypothetical protein [Dactylosporangium siamense]GIG45602.1 hypothetical protein Dsi01nite_036430 [Dactylosporangium siamense]
MGLFKRRVLPPVERLMAAAGLPTAGGPIPMPDLAMEVTRRGNGRIGRVLAVVEELLAAGGDDEIVALRLIEEVQNVLSHGSEGFLTTADVLPLRGLRTVEGWETADRFWAAVVDWCDVNAVELKPAAALDVIQHPALRATIWPTCRRLADGRRVDLADVLQYEKATGIPMTAFRPA